jgi:hypothetical protein
MTDPIYNIRGTLVRFRIEEDREEDNCKLDHFFVDATTGEYHSSMNWSPYSCPSDSDVKKYIELGCPRGVEGHSDNREYPMGFNLDHELLDAIYRAGNPLQGWKGWKEVRLIPRREVAHAN